MRFFVAGTALHAQSQTFLDLPCRLEPPRQRAARQGTRNTPKSKQTPPNQQELCYSEVVQDYTCVKPLR